MAAPKKKSRKDYLYFCIWLFGFIALCLYLLPSIINTYTNITQVITVGEAEKKIAGKSDEEIENEKRAALAYNEKLAEEQLISPFAYQGQTATDKEYESLLSSGSGKSDNIMAYIEIPSIDVYLPIAHGTSDAILSYEAGHMYGSSLPIGGKSSNAIIAAHTGLPTAKLFTDVKKLTIGDEIYITVMDETHCYVVSRIDTVPSEGNEEQKYLQIDGQKDTIVLYTCTPYGVNSERYLVRAERNTAKDKKINRSKQAEEYRTRCTRTILTFMSLLMIPVIYQLAWALWRVKRHRKQ